MNENEAKVFWDNFVKTSEDGVQSDNLDPFAHSILIEEIKNSELEGLPEWHENEGRLCFMPKLKEDGSRICILFLRNEEGAWRFSSTAPIKTRIDLIPDLPTCELPELPIQELRWNREVFETEMRIDLFTTLKDIKGIQFAIEWFADGDEFKDKVIEMLPFLPSHRAFVFYKCWFHSQLLGETTILQSFEEDRVEIHLERCKHLAIYEQNERIQSQIDKKTYLALFETTWEDRASKCGWHIEFGYEDLTTRFLLTR